MVAWLKNIDRNGQIKQLRAKGWSLADICKATGCSKSMASYHCRGIVQKPSKARVANRLKKIKQNGLKASAQSRANWQAKTDAIIKIAEDSWPAVRQDPELMGFLGVYWGEGTKRASSGKTPTISVVNNDPALIKFCLRVFKRLHPQARIDVRVRTYPEHDKDQAIAYWEKMTGLPVKWRRKDWLGKLRRCYSTHGTCTIRFSHFETAWRILTWLRLWREEIGT